MMRLKHFTKDAACSFPSGLLTIDPDDNTSICAWRNGGFEFKRFSLPDKLAKADDIVQLMYLESMFGSTLHELLSTYDYTYAIIEGVSHWAGSTVSNAYLAKGSLVQSAYLIGSYFSILRNHGFYVQILTPQEWKGQLPKEEMVRRIQLVVPNIPDGLDEHDYDAFGIGFSAVGMLDHRREFMSKFPLSTVVRSSL
jgi:hypothetical protein